MSKCGAQKLSRASEARNFLIFRRDELGRYDLQSNDSTDGLQDEDVVVFVSPAKRLAQFFGDINSTKLARDLWREEAQRLLPLIRARAGRIFLFEMKNSFVDIPFKRASLSVDLFPIVEDDAGLSLEPIVETVAALLLSHDREVSLLVEELRARSSVFDPEPLPHSFAHASAVVQNYRTRLEEFDRVSLKLEEEVSINDRLSSELTATRTDLKKKSSEIQDCKKKSDARQNEIDRLEGEKKRLLQNSDQLRHSIQSLELQISKMYTSTSWRLTAPIRAFKNALRGK